MAVPHFLNQFASKKERIEAVQFKAVENEYEQFFVRTHKVEQGVSIVLLFWVNSEWGYFWQILLGWDFGVNVGKISRIIVTLSG